jgi:hypothetical protein
VLKIFDTDDEARAWFKENDLEGVAFKQELGPLMPPALRINTARLLRTSDFLLEVLEVVRSLMAI